MSPFRNLRETLLRAGIAPRHVRRYITELSEHLDDLTERERAAGYAEDDAATRARTRLGDDATLAQAMLEQRGVRSITARAPWLVFTLLPPLSMLLIAVFWLVILVTIGGTNGFFLNNRTVPWPEWYDLLAQIMSAAINLLLMPAIALLFISIAWRQRLALIWPALATTLLLAIFAHMDTGTGLIGQNHGFVFGARWTGGFNKMEMGWTTLLDPRAWRVIAAQWPQVLTQWVLTALPMLWLWKRSKAKSM